MELLKVQQICKLFGRRRFSLEFMHCMMCVVTKLVLSYRALLRHGVSIWIDVPLDLVAKELEEDKIQLSASDTPICKSSSEVHSFVP